MLRVFVDALRGAFDTVRGGAVAAGSAIAAGLPSGAEPLWNAIENVVALALHAALGWITSIFSQVRAAWSFLSGSVGGILSVSRDFADSTARALEQLFGTSLPGLANAIRSVDDTARKTSDDLGRRVDSEVHERAFALGQLSSELREWVSDNVWHPLALSIANVSIIAHSAWDLVSDWRDHPEHLAERLFDALLVMIVERWRDVAEFAGPALLRVIIHSTLQLVAVVEDIAAAIV